MYVTRGQKVTNCGYRSKSGHLLQKTSQILQKLEFLHANCFSWEPIDAKSQVRSQNADYFCHFVQVGYYLEPFFQKEQI